MLQVLWFNPHMFKPIPLFIGLRYTRAKRRNHFISFISLISIFGIALGVMALITVLSVMNGFEKELRDRILGMASHAHVTSFESKLYNWQDVRKIIDANPEVIGSAPQIEFEAMLNYGDKVSGAMIRGVEPAEERLVADVHDHMVAGSMDNLKPGEYGIVLGKELAIALNVNLQSKVTVVTPQANVTPAGFMPRFRRFTVVGVFSVGMYEYDRATAFVHIRDAAKLMKYGEAVGGLRLKLKDMFEAKQVSAELSKTLGPDFFVADWTVQHENFFRAIKTEKRVMFFILLLIVTVAAFNIVSTLVMLVNDKRADIAIMRTLGMSPLQVMGVFMVQGMLIGAIGTLIGVVCGVLLATNVETIVPALESLFHTKFLAADVYYITELPSDLRIRDVVIIAAVSFFASILMTLYPAWTAAKTSPAEALRYE